MSWLQIHLTTNKKHAPLVELLFEKLEALSITLGDAGDEPMLEPAPGESPIWQQTRVTGLFPESTNANNLCDTITTTLPPGAINNLEVEQLMDRVWERVWLDSFHPMQFGDHLWIAPENQLPDDPDAIVVKLDPGLAFGTGTHPTTSLCLKWLSQANIEGATVIDYGCGSGILALAALRLGAKQVIAVDHDPQALEATHNNAVKNDIHGGLTLRASNQPLNARSDILLANILAGTLIELQPLLASLVKPGGQIVLSGILHEQAEPVATAFRNDFMLQPPDRQEDWVLLHGRRRS